MNSLPIVLHRDRSRGVSAGDIIDRESEQSLAVAASRGCVASRTRLVEAHLGFARRAAGQFIGRGVPYEDLVHSAQLGLLLAATRFDGSRGNRFITYAVWWVRKCLSETLRTSAIVHATRYAIERRRADAPPATPRLPTMISLDAPLCPDDPRRVGDTLADDAADGPEACLVAEDQALALRAALARLEPREHVVVAARFGFDGQEVRTYAQIGRDLGLSRERVRQIEERAIARLRRLMGLVPARPGRVGEPALSAGRVAASTPRRPR